MSGRPEQTLWFFFTPYTTKYENSFIMQPAALNIQDKGPDFLSLSRNAAMEITFFEPPLREYSRKNINLKAATKSYVNREHAVEIKFSILFSENLEVPLPKIIQFCFRLETTSLFFIISQSFENHGVQKVLDRWVTFKITWSSLESYVTMKMTALSYGFLINWRETWKHKTSSFDFIFPSMRVWDAVKFGPALSARSSSWFSFFFFFILVKFFLTRLNGEKLVLKGCSLVQFRSRGPNDFFLLLFVQRQSDDIEAFLVIFLLPSLLFFTHFCGRADTPRTLEI